MAEPTDHSAISFRGPWGELPPSISLAGRQYPCELVSDQCPDQTLPIPQRCMQELFDRHFSPTGFERPTASGKFSSPGWVSPKNFGGLSRDSN